MIGYYNFCSASPLPFASVRLAIWVDDDRVLQYEKAFPRSVMAFWNFSTRTNAPPTVSTSRTTFSAIPPGPSESATGYNSNTRTHTSSEIKANKVQQLKSAKA